MLKRKPFYKVLALFIIVMAVTGCFYNVVNAEPDNGIAMTVRAGYDDTVKLGFQVPFYVHLKNSSSDITGELEIIVNTTPDSRSAYSMPFTLPKNSEKEIVINVPLNTIDRTIEINVLKGNKIIDSTEYKFSKFIPPATPLIGLITDDPGSIKGLNELYLPEVTNGMASEIYMKYSSYSSTMPVKDGVSVASTLAELINLNSASIPSNIEALDAFNILVINNFDTSVLSNEQKSSLEKWVSKGNILIIGTGPNWKKVYGGLPESLKPYKIEGTKTISNLSDLGRFTGKQAPTGSINLASGNIGIGEVIAKEEVLPLITRYKQGSGSISVLSFDPSLAPISSWDESASLWKGLVNTLSSNRLTTSQNNSFINLNHLTSNVPESQTPPYKFLLILIGIYILIVGPVLYILLKWRDKRDWSWAMIPAAAFLVLGIIYIAGFKTRFDTAVLNTVSVIDISSDSNNYQVNSVFGVFNNKKGTMKINYPKASDINVTSNYYVDYGYYQNQQKTENEAPVTNRIKYTDPVTYELYQTRLWQPAYISGSKTIPSKGEVINTLSLIDGRLKTVIKNTTGFSLKDAFIVVGNNFIEIGDLDPQDEKAIDVLLDSGDVYKKAQSFLDNRYGNIYKATPADRRSKEWVENNRKRNIIENILSIKSQTVNPAPVISLYAFNYDDPEYGLTVNGQRPKSYNTNIIHASMNINFEKNNRITLPTGIINATLIQGENKFYNWEDPNMGSIMVHEDSDVDFLAMLPSNIKAENIKIIWDNVIPAYVKYQSQSKQALVYGKNVYKYYIFNNSTQNWDEITSGQVIDQNISAYVGKNMEIKLRANVKVDKSASPDMLLGVPDLEISGVVK